MQPPNSKPRQSKFTQPELAQLKKLTQQPEWQVVLRVNDVMLEEMRRNHANAPVLPTDQEATQSAALKGGVQALKDLFLRIHKESNRDIHGQLRD